jgi:hypothetical protein
MSDNYDTSYIEFHQQLLTAFIRQIKQQAPFNQEHSDQDNKDFITELEQLPNIGGSEQLIQGQQLLCKLVAGYHHLMPLLPRDLLWFFGGDCLHYMPDDEISIFQTLDEQRHSAKETGQPFNYERVRLNALGAH